MAVTLLTTDLYKVLHGVACFILIGLHLNCLLHAGNTLTSMTNKFVSIIQINDKLLRKNGKLALFMCPEK